MPSANLLIVLATILLNASISFAQSNENLEILAYQDSIQGELNKQKSHLDSQFINKRNLKDFKEITETGQILIGDLFSSKKKYAVIVYKNSDTSIDAKVLVENGSLWDTVLVHQASCYYSEYMPYSEIIELEDFDGDHILDLRIINNYWETHPGNSGNIWLFKDGQFNFLEGSDVMVTPHFDAKTNRIYSYQSDGCGDMNMEFIVYQIFNNQVKEIDNIYCDCCECKQGFCTINEKQIPLSQAHLSVPVYFRDMIKYKVKYCK